MDFTSLGKGILRKIKTEKSAQKRETRSTSPIAPMHDAFGVCAIPYIKRWD